MCIRSRRFLRVGEMRNEKNCATRRRRRGSPAMRRDGGYSMAGGVVPGTNRIFFGPREMIGSQGETVRRIHSCLIPLNHHRYHGVIVFLAASHR